MEMSRPNYPSCIFYLSVWFFPLQAVKRLLAQEIKSSFTTLQCASKPVARLLMVKSIACKTLLLWTAVAAHPIHTWITRITVCPSPSVHVITRDHTWNLGNISQKMENAGMFYFGFLFVGKKPFKDCLLGVRCLGFFGTLMSVCNAFHDIFMLSKALFYCNAIYS